MIYRRMPAQQKRLGCFARQFGASLQGLFCAPGRLSALSLRISYRCSYSWFWCKRWESVSWPVRSPICDYSAVRAAQIAGIVFGRPGRLPTLNWCFLILAASSMPLIVTAAVSKRLKPSIGLIRCFTRR